VNVTASKRIVLIHGEEGIKKGWKKHKTKNLARIHIVRQTKQLNEDNTLRSLCGGGERREERGEKKLSLEYEY
jgi:hypothetical protein